MIRKYLLPALALIGFGLAFGTVLRGNQPTPAASPVAEPANAPFASYISGAGIVEAATENIPIGTPVSGIVTAIYVKWGEQVGVGDPLFKVDDRDLRAQLLPALAKVEEADATLALARNQLKLAESVPDKRAISVEELTNRRLIVTIDEATLALAKAQVQQLKVEIDRRTVRALVAGQILQIKIRPGQFAPAGVTNPPLMLLGNDLRLNVRVDIDEADAWRFRPGEPAIANVRGNAELRTPLRLERVEPYVVPKTSLTGDTAERVDTRVMQVIYSFDPTSLPVHVGQLMDVFIEAPGLSSVKAQTKSEGNP
jgi:RND family efflux transporter MFP subunit